MEIVTRACVSLALLVAFAARGQAVPVGSSSAGVQVVGSAGSSAGALSAGSVTTTEILNATILAADFSTGAVDTAAILNATILAADFSTGAVDTAAILNGTILAADFSTGAADTAAILNNTILAIDFAVGAVDTAAILNGTILAADFSTGAVDTAAILDGTIASGDLNSATVTATQIVGPASATDEACARFDGTTGKLMQDGANCTISDAGLLTNVGVTTTGAVTISGVTNDITTVSNQDLTLAPNGVGSVVIQSGDDTTEFADSAGSAKLSVQTNTGNSRSRIFSGGTNGAVGFGTTLGIGQVNDTSVTNIVGCFADSISSASGAAGTQLVCVYGGGKIANLAPQTATCASTGDGSAGALTFDATSGLVNVVNNDAHGCIITLSETSAVTGSKTLFIVTATAGGTVTFANAANVHAGPTFATTTGLGLGDAYEVAYAATVLQYVGIGATDN